MPTSSFYENNPTVTETIEISAIAEEVLAADVSAADNAAAAAASAATALQAKLDAQSSAVNAANSAAAAATSSQGLSAAVVQANTYATNSANSATAAATSAANAATSATTAANTVATVAASAAEANSHKIAAGNSATLAQEWATKTNAEVVTGEGFGAKKYATDAASSATAASSSASTASTQATNAANSATAAAASASTATTKAAEAATSATNAASSATSASSSASTATTKASEASTSASNAASSASAAATSATNAASSATSAASSAAAAQAAAGSVNMTNYYNKTESDARYAAVSHTHAISAVTGLQTALDGKASATHSHAIADVTGLQTALDGKLATTGGTLTGNLTFSGNTLRIGGDTINATVSNRLLWQDSGTNQSTAFGVVPNGTATSSFVQLFNSSTPDNSSILTLVSGPTRVGITSTGLGTGSALPMIFSTAGTDRMTIDTSGNVGIGTTPAAGTRLHISGGELLVDGGASLSAVRYAINGTNRSVEYWSESTSRFISAINSTGTFQWSSNGTQRMLLDSSGNLGINQTSPATKLDVNGSMSQNVVAVAASAIDCSLGNVFTKTASGALTWTFTNVPASRTFTVILELTNGGTGTQTWPAAVKWPAGTAPTLTASGVDVLGFITDDGGTTWRGVQLMKDSK